jgi:hypothetical protein
MKKRSIIIIKNAALLFSLVLFFAACKKNDMMEDQQKNPADAIYQMQEQMARPAINTVFNSSADKDAFNTTIPSEMAAAFGVKFKNRLLALNPGYTTNLLGLNADQFSGALVTDVLTASKTGITTFFDGTNVLTGRALSDDVIDVELTLIFGGPNGTDLPQLTSDHVNGNDLAFKTSFPYLADAH